MNPEQAIANEGLSLPPPPSPGGSYVPTVRTGNLIYVSGQVPKAASGEMVHPGKLGENLSVQQGQEAARQAALNALALVKAAAGSLEAVNRIVHVTVHVASAPDFHEQHVVANGASDFLLKVFGDVGRHSRAALGAVSLPINASIELEMLVEV